MTHTNFKLRTALFLLIMSLFLYSCDKDEFSDSSFDEMEFSDSEFQDELKSIPPFLSDTLASVGLAEQLTKKGISDIEIGNGYDFDRNIGVNRDKAGLLASIPRRTTHPQRLSYNYTYISSSEDIDKAFGLDASISGEYSSKTVVAKAGVSAEVSTSLKREISSNSKSIFVVASAQVLSQEQNIPNNDYDNLALNSTAKSELNKGTSGFKSRYGRGIVTKVSRGVNYYVVYKFDYNNVTSKSENQVSSAINGYFSNTVTSGEVSTNSSVNWSNQLGVENIKVTIEEVSAFEAFGLPKGNSLKEVANKLIVHSANKDFYSLELISYEVKSMTIVPEIHQHFLGDYYDRQYDELLDDKKDSEQIKSLMPEYLKLKSDFHSLLNVYSKSLSSNVKFEGDKAIEEDLSKIINNQNPGETKTNPVYRLLYPYIESGKLQAAQRSFLIPDNFIGKVAFKNDNPTSQKYLSRNRNNNYIDLTGSRNDHYQHWNITIHQKMKAVTSLFDSEVRFAHPFYRITNSNNGKYDLALSSLDTSEQYHKYLKCVPIKSGGYNQLFGVEQVDNQSFKLFSYGRFLFLNKRSDSSWVNIGDKNHSASNWTIEKI